MSQQEINVAERTALDMLENYENFVNGDRPDFSVYFDHMQPHQRMASQLFENLIEKPAVVPTRDLPPVIFDKHGETVVYPVQEETIIIIGCLPVRLVVAVVYKNPDNPDENLSVQYQGKIAKPDSPE